MKTIVLRNMEAERVRNGFSKEALSAELGITSKTYLSWIRGVTEIPSNKLMAMSKMWQVNIEYLLEKDDTDQTEVG